MAMLTAKLKLLGEPPHPSETGTRAHVCAMSALPPKRTLRASSVMSATCQKRTSVDQSMTWSARAIMDDGTGMASLSAPSIGFTSTLSESATA